MLVERLRDEGNVPERGRIEVGKNKLEEFTGERLELQGGLAGFQVSATRTKSFGYGKDVGIVYMRYVG